MHLHRIPAKDALTSQARREINPLYFFPLELGEEGSGGAFIVVRFWPTPRSWHVSHLVITSRDIRQDLPVEHLLEVPSNSSRGHSSFQGFCLRSLFLRGLHGHPEVDSWGWFFPLRAMQLHQLTLLIIAFNSANRIPLSHEINYATRSSHILNVATTPTPARTITEGSRILSQQSRA